MIPKKLFDEFECSGPIFAPARAGRVVLFHPVSAVNLTIWNIHVFDISELEMNDIAHSLAADYLRSENSGGTCLVLVAGDFNYRVLADARFYMQDPS
jgi:hypothetical protein